MSSKTNWKTVHEKQNKARYKWPDGWDSRDTVAEQLECSPDRVSQLLAPGLKGGEIESQAFPVWDDTLKRLVKITGYRTAAKRPARDDSEDLISGQPAPRILHFAAGQIVISRRKNRGRVQKDLSVLWDNGTVTKPSVNSLRKCDIKVIG